MIALVRSYIPDLDARAQRYMRSLESSDLPFLFIGWQRGTSDGTTEVNTLLYQGEAGVGRKWRNLPSLVGWFAFVFAELWRRRNEIEIGQFADLDSALPGFLFCKLAGKPFVFDLYDQYSSSRNIRGSAARFLDFIERELCRRADLVILPTSDRKVQHDIAEISGKILILENVPALEVPYVPCRADNELHIGYLGVLEPVHRGLENLVELASRNSDIRLTVAGYGPLEEFIKAASAEHGNIRFLGAMTQVQGLLALRECNILAGLYLLSNANHQFASPNKYYEHLMLGRPLLTTMGTPPGAKVESCQTGWAIKDSMADMEDWFDQLESKQIEAFGRNARELWCERYRGYYEQNYALAYPQALRSVLKRGPDG